MANSGCPASYSTPKGLNFTVYCGLDATGIGDLSTTGADSLEDCLDGCALLTGGLCGAAAFDSNTLRCFFKDTNTTSSDATPRSGWTLGVVDAAQVEPASSLCPSGSTGTQETTTNGLDFTVYCNQDFVGNAICSDSEPSCRIHTDSLQDCMEFCSTHHPRCTGVAWRPDMAWGYLNCYPKSASSSDLDKGRYDASHQVHCAKALLEIPDNMADVCEGRENGTVKAIAGDAFQLLCDQDHPDDTLGTQHEDALDDCLEACASYADGECVGMVFDNEMLNGYENCYLKNGTSTSTSARDGFTLAVRQLNDSSVDTNGTTTGTGSTDGDGNGGGGGGTGSASKAWIAGPVAGGVVAILLILMAFWWRRRKRAHANRMSRTGGTSAHGIAQEQKTWQRQELDAPLMAKSTALHERRHELDAGSGLQELDGAEVTAGRILRL